MSDCGQEMCPYWPGEGCVKGIAPCDEAGQVYDRMIARTQDGPDPLVPEPGPGKGT
jgi:hypothetical protein